MRAWRILTWAGVFVWIWLFCTLKIFAADAGTEDGQTITMLAKLVHSEAGNQSLDGKRYVVDVVLNRVDSETFPDTVEDVIYQTGQFTVIKNGSFNMAIPTEEDYTAVLMELVDRTNEEILYFTAGGYGIYGTPAFKEQDHYFCKK